FILSHFMHSHHFYIIVFLLIIPLPPRFSLFPYTTLFRSFILILIPLLFGLYAQFRVSSAYRKNLEIPSRGHITEFRDFSDRHSRDRKSTRLNSSHSQISYAVFCLKKKNKVKRTSETYKLHGPINENLNTSQNM